MPLRTCAVCAGDLAASATARAKYCSATCRKRASRGAPVAEPLKLVPRSDDDEPVDPASYLDSLEANARRLDKLLDLADPRSAAPLSKEYRDTLREIEQIRAANEPVKDRNGRTGSVGRPFDVAAV